MPPTIAPTASDSPACQPQRANTGLSAITPRIAATLSRAGASAGMKNRPYVFKIPIATAATATAQRNGARMRVIVTASASFSGVNPAA
jgi:hypothetical protein